MVQPRRSATRRFESILYPVGVQQERAATSEDALRDLALDQVLERLTHAGEEDLAVAFRTPLGAVDAILYRHEVFRVLEVDAVRTAVTTLADGLRESADLVRSVEQSRNATQRARLHLNAVLAYVTAVVLATDALPDALDQAGSRSTAFDGLLDHLSLVRRSAEFLEIEGRAAALDEQWRALRFDVLISGGRVTVAAFDDEPDLGTYIIETFERFRQGSSREYRAHVTPSWFDHVQEQILDSVVRLFPERFAGVQEFTAAHRTFADPTLMRFAHEIRFYGTVVEHLAPLRKRGLGTCYPTVSAVSKDVDAKGTFDLALALGSVPGATIVTNDLQLSGAERILVISGPNQGGKSTTARAFGQLLHLASIGCPVPGTEVRVPLIDQVLTHFEREETLETLEGRLGSEVHRIHDLLEAATPESAIVLNEIFTATTVSDARALTGEVLKRISGLGAVAVCVTFVDELSRLNEATVSMVSTVAPDDPARRTFEVRRRRADGRAYAAALAAKHGLTVDAITAAITASGARR